MGIQERRQREREARRKLVLDSARQLVRERGLNGTTTRLIAERSELSEATLFWYFKNKDEIFTSLLFEGIDFLGDGVDRIIAMEASSGDKLRELWRFFGMVQSEHPEYFYVFAYLAHPQSTAAIADELRDELARRSGDNFRRFAKLLGELGIEGKARVVADLLWGAFTGLVLLRSSRENLGAPPHPNAKELEAAFELLVAGLAPQEDD